MIAHPDSRVTIHMAASLDGFIPRKDGRVDWLETSDEFAGGDTLDPAFVEAFLKTIDCYVMGDNPTFVLTGRDLPRIRDTVEFYKSGMVELSYEVRGQRGEPRNDTA